MKKRTPLELVFLVHEDKEKHPIYVSKKCCGEENIDLLLIRKEGKRHYVLIKDFNTFMYDHTLIMEENIFVVVVYKLLVQKKY